MIRVLLVSAALLGQAAVPALAQDVAAGEQTFRICRACHQIGPGAHNSIGPVLNGVVGRKAGSIEGYQYSPANKDSGLTWTPDEPDKYLAVPGTVVPHTKMIFPGLKDESQRKNVIAFLEQYKADGSKN